MSWRRAVGAAVVLAWLSVPALGALSAGDHHGRCSDHVCQCRQHCPPKRPAAGKSCHDEGEAGLPASEMTSRCDHGTDGFTGVARSNAIPVPAEQLHPSPESTPAPNAARLDPEAGYPRLDRQPPRIAS
jgi:hypothetical protein